MVMLLSVNGWPSLSLSAVESLSLSRCDGTLLCASLVSGESAITHLL